MNSDPRSAGRETALDLYVSPHLDDVVLSCGGRVAASGREERSAVVVTVFAAPTPLQPPTPFAREYHKMMGIVEDPFRRRSEDRASLEVLAAQPVHLQHLDCIYRIRPDGTPLVNDEPDIFRFSEAEEQPLIEKVTADLIEVISQTEADKVFVPLALGWHRDHVLTRHVAERAVQLAKGSPRLQYYEDIPYAIEAPHDLPEATQDMSAEVFDLTSTEMAARLEAISRYVSQEEILWHDGGGLLPAIRKYATRVGDGTPAERYWRPPND